jgi:hypothetical protein
MRNPREDPPAVARSASGQAFSRRQTRATSRQTARAQQARAPKPISARRMTSPSQVTRRRSSRSDSESPSVATRIGQAANYGPLRVRRDAARPGAPSPSPRPSPVGNGTTVIPASDGNPDRTELESPSRMHAQPRGLATRSHGDPRTRHRRPVERATHLSRRASASRSSPLSRTPFSFPSARLRA